jgi:hypothetical protein
VSIWALRFSSDGHSPPGATFSDRRLHKWHTAGKIRGLQSYLHESENSNESPTDSPEAAYLQAQKDDPIQDAALPEQQPQPDMSQLWEDDEAVDSEYDNAEYDNAEYDNAEYDNAVTENSYSGRPKTTASSQSGKTSDAILVINRDSLLLIGGFLGLALQLIACFLPWVQMGVLSIRGIKGDGQIAFAVTSLTIIGVVAGMKWQSKTRFLERVASGWGTIAFFWMLALMISLESKFAVNADQNVFEKLINASVSPGAGLYLGLISGLLTAISFAFYAFYVSQKAQSQSKARSDAIQT